jgi:hypothetical protein
MLRPYKELPKTIAGESHEAMPLSREISLTIELGAMLGAIFFA